MVCPHCHTATRPDAKFCAHCGAALPPALPGNDSGAALPPNTPGICQFPGCTKPVAKPGHTLCYTHWKASRPAHTAPPVDELRFRKRFPARHRTIDGHLVRSKAELLIDNWLYMAGIVHAYERQLPIAETLYCDFYLPKGNIYIEYWGMERDATYRARKSDKQAIYRQYALHLIEVTDEQIKYLDDYLPRQLLPYGVQLL